MSDSKTATSGASASATPSAATAEDENETMPRRAPGSPSVWRKFADLRRPICTRLLLTAQTNAEILCVMLLRPLYDRWRRPDSEFRRASLMRQNHATACLTRDILQPRTATRYPLMHWAAIGERVGHHLMHALNDNGRAAHDDCAEAGSIDDYAHTFQRLLTQTRAVHLWVTDAGWHTSCEWRVCLLVCEYAYSPADDVPVQYRHASERDHARRMAAAEKTHSDMLAYLRAYHAEPWCASAAEAREIFVDLCPNDALRPHLRRLTNAEIRDSVWCMFATHRH